MASCFNILIGIWHIRYFFFTFCPAIIWTWETSLEDWKMLIRWCRTDICSCKPSAKVSLMLDNPFLVPSLCKLNHYISVCFIKISTKPPHHYHCIFVFLEDITQSTVFIQYFLSSQNFSRLSRSFSWSSDRLLLKYLEISLRIRLSYVMLFLVFQLIFSMSLQRLSVIF